MGIILDLIIIAIIAVNVYLCYKKGLVNLAVGLIAVVAAIILSVILYKPVTNIIVENTDFDETLKNTIVETFTPEGADGSQVRYVGILSYLETELGNVVNETQNEVVYETANVMAVKIINLIVFIAIFTVVRVALFALTFVADAISLPILKQLDDVGGILYGFVKALLIIYVVLAIVSVVVSFMNNTAISELIENSYITKFFYNNNLILNILL